jgi:hypothetical protein
MNRRTDLMTKTRVGGRRTLWWRAVGARLVRSAIGLGLALSLGACDLDEILTAEDPDVATPESLDNPQALLAVLAGAKSEFQVAYSGNTGAEGQINLSGLFADELLNAESFPTRIEVDQRNVTVDNATTQGLFRALARARASAQFAVEKFEKFDEGVAGHSEALSHAGFAIILFGENYCSGVPFSRLTESGATEYGEPLTTTQMFDTAVARFDAALTIATSASVADDNLAALARVGKARAQLALGQFAAAATTIGGPTGVDDEFVYLVEHSENSTREQNGVFVFNQISERWTVSDNEGINGLPFRSDNDPRVPYRRSPATDVGFDNFTPQFDQLKYPSRSADVPLATGLEARLIEAEADLRNNQLVDWLAKLNALRANPPSYTGVAAGALAPLVAPATQAARENLHFKERAYWLWLTSHRLGDLRRLVKFYGRTQDAVFPTGPYPRSNIGGQYGTDVNLPLPIDEANNPNVAKTPGGLPQCIDRNA